jgi:hypothetical protein
LLRRLGVSTVAFPGIAGEHPCDAIEANRGFGRLATSGPLVEVVRLLRVDPFVGSEARELIDGRDCASPSLGATWNDRLGDVSATVE